MPTSTRMRFSRRLLLCCLLIALPGLARPRAAETEPLKLTCQLIWGTDGAKPDDVKCKEVDRELKGRLARVFKWKNYFEIRRKHLILQEPGTHKVKMSEECLLEFSLPEADTLEVKLIGEGRWTKTARQSAKALRRGELLVVAGDARDNDRDAWFVVIAETPKKEPASVTIPPP